MLRGFTLIELLISVGIFSIVMVIALGALLAMSEADRKAQTLKTVINNLNFGLESMSRTIRTGYDYKCDDPTTGGDCTTGTHTYLAFTAANGDKVAYCLHGGVIKRQIVASTGSLNSSCSASVYQPLTSSEVVIERLNFFVSGSSRSDNQQPRVTILVSGYVLFKEGQRSQFNIQTTATQRVYDQ